MEGAASQLSINPFLLGREDPSSQLQERPLPTHSGPQGHLGTAQEVSEDCVRLYLLPKQELLKEHHFTPNPPSCAVRHGGGGPGFGRVGSGPGQALRFWQWVLLCL